MVEHRLRHAIHAAEVAAVGHRNAQVAYPAPAPVQQFAMQRRGKVVARRRRGFERTGNGDNAGVGFHVVTDYKPARGRRQLLPPGCISGLCNMDLQIRRFVQHSAYRPGRTSTASSAEFVP